MNCSKVRRLLSAYYDGQLAPPKRHRLAAHLAGCRACAAELELYQRLSGMVRQLGDPKPPAAMWQAIEAELDAPAPQPAERRTRGLSLPRLAALAAVLLVAVTLGGLAVHQAMVGHGHQHAAADLSDYLTAFEQDPHAAQQILLSRYPARAVRVDEAAEHLGYQPAVSKGLPEGYRVDSVYVLKMPCCTCVQCLCRSEDGRLLAIFEHDVEQSVHLGQRPAQTKRCNGKQCQLMQLKSRLAATWQAGSRHITLVGARDLHETAKMIEALD